MLIEEQRTGCTSDLFFVVYRLSVYFTLAVGKYSSVWIAGFQQFFMTAGSFKSTLPQN